MHISDKNIIHTNDKNIIIDLKSLFIKSPR
uniref:Uncharacterized protein n=1 Tax=Siphoviridae sp. ct16M3 TaxID=2825305 RepID=A0A8S5PPB9_9CAUD|nr:MAG TPA: hypothetical protein [Siphoviridae sp. ct16M3]